MAAQAHAPGGGERVQRAVRARGLRGGGLGADLREQGAAVGAARREEGRVEEAHAAVQAVPPARAVVQPA